VTTDRPAAADLTGTDDRLPAIAAPVAPTIAELDLVIADCRACPRLVAWRELVARDQKLAFRCDIYWGRAFPGFGPADATVLIVGLAPAARGANRTGRKAAPAPPASRDREPGRSVGSPSTALPAAVQAVGRTAGRPRLEGHA
jgi:hypothetical protein